MNWTNSWQFWAIGSALFAALTALFGKVGVTEINSNLATFIRTVVILGMTALVVSFGHQWKKPDDLSHQGLLFLVLSALATGFSWLCYYRALQLGPISSVAPVDKLSVALAMVLGFIFLGEAVTARMVLGGILIVAGSLLVALK
jgi:bacterial/archaeal transporter family protein